MLVHIMYFLGGIFAWYVVLSIVHAIKYIWGLRTEALRCQVRRFVLQENESFADRLVALEKWRDANERHGQG